MMKLLLLVCLFYLVSSECYQFKCVDDTQKGVCKILNEEDLTIQMKKCDKGESCIASSTTKAVCVNKKKDGEKCSSSTDCFSGNCKDSICVGKSEGVKCIIHEECQKSLYCDTTCKKFKSDGEECSSLIECEFGYGCGMTKEGGQMRCTKLLSIKSGEYSSSPELCETGYTTKEKKCATTTSSVEGKACTSDEDCPIKIKYGSAAEVEGSGSCTCNFPSKTYMCEYTTSNSAFQTYINALKQYFEGKPKTEYIVEAKTATTYQIRKLGLDHSVQYKNAPDCVVDFILGEDDTPEPTPSLSGFIQISLLALSLLVFI